MRWRASAPVYAETQCPPSLCVASMDASRSCTSCSAETCTNSPEGALRTISSASGQRMRNSPSAEELPKSLTRPWQLSGSMKMSMTLGWRSTSLKASSKAWSGSGACAILLTTRLGSILDSSSAWRKFLARSISLKPALISAREGTSGMVFRVLPHVTAQLHAVKSLEDSQIFVQLVRGDDLAVFFPFGALVRQEGVEDLLAEDFGHQL